MNRLTLFFALCTCTCLSLSLSALAAPSVDPLYTAATGNLPQSGNWVDQLDVKSTAAPTAVPVPSGADTYLLNATGYVWVCDNPSRCGTTKPAGQTSGTTAGTGWVLGPISRIKPAPSGTIYLQAVSGTGPVSGSIEWFKRQ